MLYNEHQHCIYFSNVKYVFSCYVHFNAYLCFLSDITPPCFISIRFQRYHDLKYMVRFNNRNSLRYLAGKLGFISERRVATQWTAAPRSASWWRRWPFKLQVYKDWLHQSTRGQVKLSWASKRRRRANQEWKAARDEVQSILARPQRKRRGVMSSPSTATTTRPSWERRHREPRESQRETTPTSKQFSLSLCPQAHDVVRCRWTTGKRR